MSNITPDNTQYYAYITPLNMTQFNRNYAICVRVNENVWSREGELYFPEENSDFLLNGESDRGLNGSERDLKESERGSKALKEKEKGLDMKEEESFEVFRESEPGRINEHWLT